MEWCLSQTQESHGLFAKHIVK